MARLQHGPSTIEQTPEVGPIRTLTRADLTHLAAKRTPTMLQSLRDSHHRLARAVASGMPSNQISTLCGVSANRVSMLKSDPSFAELVAHYRGLLTAEWLEAADPVIEFLGSVRTKALAMIEDKLDAASEAGEFLPSRDLATFAELGLDRTGYGKVNKNVNVNVDFAANLEKARSRSSRAKTINPSPALVPIDGTSSHAHQSVAARAPAQVPQRQSTFRRV